VERGDPGAHQRVRLDGRQFLGQTRDRTGGSDQVLRVSAIKCHAGDLAGLAGEEIPTTAVVAVPAISAVPPNARSLAWRPSSHAGANRIDHSRHLMTRNPRVPNARKNSLFDDRIAVTDATSLYLDSDRSSARFRYRTFNDLKRTVRSGDLHNTHCSHGSSNQSYSSVKSSNCL